MAARAQSAKHDGDLRQLLHLVRRFAPRSYGKKFPLTKHKGITATSPVHSRELLQQHFTDLKPAQIVAVDDYLKSTILEVHGPDIHLCLPSKSFLQCALLPNLKQSCCDLAEPAQWKRGTLQEIPKKSNGVCVDTDTHRGVILADDMGKKYHRLIRSRVTPHLESYVLSSMYGGFLKRGTDFGTLHLKTMVAYAKVKCLSIAILYTDACSAVESVIRALVCGPRLSDEQIRTILKRLRFNQQSFHLFVKVCHDPAAMDAAGVPSSLRDLVRSVLNNTWFSIEGLASISVTRKHGTRAGDPLGDLIFSFLMAMVLHACDKRIKTIEVHKIDLPDSPTLMGAAEDLNVLPEAQMSYLDDGTFYAVVKKTIRALEVGVAIGSIVFDAFAAHGLILHISHGKQPFPLLSVVLALLRLSLVCLRVKLRLLRARP